jgi:hypothetical protein
MTGAEVLSVIMARIGTGSGVTGINTELQNVLYDISSRADFLTTVTPVETSDGVAEYDQPEGLKRIYECYITGSEPLEVKTYRDYLKYLAEEGISNDEPTMYARRHGKLYFWPVPDGVYTVNVDHARYHPSTWTDILFGPQFNEAVFEGVLTALYKGQLFEKLRLNNKKITSRDIAENATDSVDRTTTTDKEGTADDSTVTVDEDATGGLNTDDDTDVLTYEFSKDFPEITKHEELYEAEIQKLIENMEIDTETVLVEYRDI